MRSPGSGRHSRAHQVQGGCPACQHLPPPEPKSMYPTRRAGGTSCPGGHGDGGWPGQGRGSVFLSEPQFPHLCSGSTTALFLAEKQEIHQTEGVEGRPGEQRVLGAGSWVGASDSSSKEGERRCTQDPRGSPTARAGAPPQSWDGWVEGMREEHIRASA